MVYLNSKEKRCDPIEWHINELEDVILDQAGDISKFRAEFFNELLERMMNEYQDKYLVIVDCHV